MVPPLAITPYALARRYVGMVDERPGAADHPLIQWWLSLCGFPETVADETPWCSAFVNGICWELELPRSRSAAARSWLLVGETVPLAEAQVGFDVVILSRGTGAQPPATVIAAPGHVGWYSGHTGSLVTLVGGNQGNGVSVQNFPLARVLGVRRVRRR